MKQLVLHVAYGFNGESIASMTTAQMIRAFHIANEHLPTITTKSQTAIKQNMARIADEISDRTDRARGGAKIRLEVQLIVMQTIIKKLYA